MGRAPKKPTERPSARPDAAAAVSAAALAAALAGAALLVDPLAEASFDAPKRLAALVLIGIAFAAAFAAGGRGSPRGLWRGCGRPARAALVLLVAALSWTLASAILSPRAAEARDASRALFVFALLLPLGASRVVSRYGRTLLAAFLGPAAANAALSLLQGRGIFQPFALQATGSRDATGALVGNVGYLALALALAFVAALAVALEPRRRWIGIVCAASLPLFLADLVVNQNLTSLTAVGAGATALLCAKFGRRAAVPTAAILLGVLLALVAYAPARERAANALAAGRAGNWDVLLTYRLGPWASALEMARERPALGFGPGTFAAEFVPHRLKAELRARRRFVNPLVTSSYGEAHSEPLQALAEGGLAGLAAVGAAAALLLALWRTARRGGDGKAEAALLFGILVAGAVGALTWFPLQRPVTAIPLLLAAGRGWRLCAESDAREQA